MYPTYRHDILTHSQRDSSSRSFPTISLGKKKARSIIDHLVLSCSYHVLHYIPKGNTAKFSWNSLPISTPTVRLLNSVHKYQHSQHWHLVNSSTTRSECHSSSMLHRLFPRTTVHAKISPSTSWMHGFISRVGSGWYISQQLVLGSWPIKRVWGVDADVSESLVEVLGWRFLSFFGLNMGFFWAVWVFLGNGVRVLACRFCSPSMRDGAVLLSKDGANIEDVFSMIACPDLLLFSCAIG